MQYNPKKKNPRLALLWALTVLVSVLFAGCHAYSTEASQTSSSNSSSYSSSVSSSNSSASSSEESPENSYDPWKGNDVYVPSDAETDPSILEKLEQAVSKNSDVIGWLQIPGTGVDYAVVQTTDNEYYLTHDADNLPSKNGAIYAHYGNALSNPFSLPSNSTLFGHNTLMDNDPMFMELLDFYDLTYAQEHRYMTFTFPDGTTTYWEIFAVVDTLAEDDNFYYYDPSPTSDQLEHLIQEAAVRSYFNYDITVSSQDNILSLSTCTYKYRNWLGFARTDVRLVIMARLLHQGENLKDFPVPVENAQQVNTISG